MVAVMDAPAPDSVKPAETAPEQSVPPAIAPASWWERILTTTPVVLTVIATLLAGQSSSEMTRAQYHRSVAAQLQSKVGDQWAFFQAKRTRKLILEQANDFLESGTASNRLEVPAIQALADRLPDDFRQAEIEALALIEGIAHQGKVAARLTSLNAAASRTLRVAKQGRTDADSARAAMSVTLAAMTGGGQSQPVMTWLKSDQLPTIRDSRIEDKAIERARQAIADRRPETEIAALVRLLAPESVRQAIVATEGNAAAFDEQTRPIDQFLRRLSAAAGNEARLVRGLTRSLRDLKSALASAAPTPAVQPIADRLERQATDMRGAADEVANALKAAWNRFTASRYDRDAVYNQDAAYLYEIQVHQESALSDRHLARSKSFFYGLLAAQMAVTIATLALAVRQKSVLWGLASAAGLGAVLYGVYVYLDLLP